jgi:hypothetical protein
VRHFPDARTACEISLIFSAEFRGADFGCALSRSLHPQDVEICATYLASLASVLSVAGSITILSCGWLIHGWEHCHTVLRVAYPWLGALPYCLAGGLSMAVNLPRESTAGLVKLPTSNIHARLYRLARGPGRNPYQVSRERADRPSLARPGRRIGGVNRDSYT